MARIAGVNLPAQKHVWVGLQSIYRHWPYPFEEAVRMPLASPRPPRSATCPSRKSSACVPKSAKFVVEGDLRREVGISIKRLMDLGCYRGLRHRRGLPLRGQRTRTNARTRKGPRKAIKK